MFAGVMVEVNQLRCAGNALIGGFFDRGGRADKSDHGAVMVEIGMAIQNMNARNSLNGGENGFDDFGTASV